MGSLGIDPNEEFAATMRGKTLRVPSLMAVMKEWPQGDNYQYYERLRNDIDGLLDM
jgi:hypothetical protein